MWQYVAFAAVGVAAGFSSALLGIGGGVIIVPVLVMLFAISAKAATATSLAYIAPVAIYSALTHWFKGHEIQWRLVLLAVPGGLIGAQLGLIAKQHITDAQLKVIFGILMVLVGFKLLLSPWTDGTRPAPANAEPPSIEATQ